MLRVPSWDFKSLKTSNPLRSGITRSRTIREGDSKRARSAASAPFVSITLYRLALNKCLTRYRAVASSSTTIIDGLDSFTSDSVDDEDAPSAPIGRVRINVEPDPG